ncbi:MAG TPA: hypothetical protein VN782_02440 [Usitatibacter sp.]|nr:hypothetical protein [Usitatibacter sp.]
MRNMLVLVLALALGGCATNYQLALMPHDRGVIYHGVAEDLGGGEGPISVTIDDKTYTGTWVQSTPAHSTAFVGGGWGWWGWRGAMGGIVTMDNPEGVESKALLSAPDGSGLRCDLRTDRGTGAGMCRDDRGRIFDVQLRPR